LNNTAPIISLQQLSKHYGSVRALDGLNLEINAGPTGLLGPNGAGKTTLLKLLLGQLVPDAGTAHIAGADPLRRDDRLQIRRLVGYMPENDCLLPRHNGIETVITLGQLSGMTYHDAMKRAHEVLDYVGLDEARYRQMEEYSGGMKQRLKLAQALVHDPDILLLDEPTSGLDPKGRRHMLDLVHDLGHQQSKSILLCSHLLQDIEKTCSHVVVLHQGKALHTGALDAMTHDKETWMRVEVAAPAERFVLRMKELNMEFEREAAQRFRIQLEDGAEYGDELFDLALACSTAVTRLTPIRSSLEEVFVATLEDDAASRARDEAQQH
jgi:ABC-2 type transport system ATP-binding protein